MPEDSHRVEIVAILVIVIAAYAVYPLAFAFVTASQPGPESGAPATPVTDAPGSSAETSFELREDGALAAYTYENGYEGMRSVMSNAGVYAADYDSDGWTDVLAIGGEQPVLFRNDRGEFRRSGALPAVNRTVRSALFFDYDDDGWEDLLLLPTGATPMLFRNANGSFVRASAGFEDPLAVPIGASTGDFDEDECLDVVVIQYGDWSRNRPDGLRNYSVPPGEDNGNENVLYDGNCRSFTRQADAGLDDERWSLAASVADFTGDGRPDVHVANDFNTDVLYVNRGDGTFARRTLGPRTNRNGMSSELLDVDGDGALDVFVSNIYYPRYVNEKINTTMPVKAHGNNLLLGSGNGTWEERGAAYGVRQGGWGWAAVAADFDGDGAQELFHTTRRMSFRSSSYRIPERRRKQIKATHPYYSYPAFWERSGDQFEQRLAGGVGLTETNGRGVASLDVDRDGDLDLVVANVDGPYRVYENTADGGSHVQVELSGPARQTVGARLTVTSGGVTQFRVRNAKADYLSQDTRVLHAGIGNNTRATVRVTWADGSETVVPAVEVGHRVTVSPAGAVNRTELAG